MQLDELHSLAGRLRDEIEQVVFGQRRVASLLINALLSEGHVLLEGVPGTAKTLMAMTFAQRLSLEFKRIQFTPDLMPGDVLGTNLFNFQTNQFVLNKGPIFTQILLADEINRTPPKTQAALLEAMQERRVTIDGTSHVLGDGFMVIATQNPIEQEGTYPLPEAQLDRFLFKIPVGYPSREHELQMLRTHGQTRASATLESAALTDLDTLRRARALIDTVTLSEPLMEYIVDLVRATRHHPALLSGASPRAATMLARTTRTLAALSGRAYVIPDDVQSLLTPALAHRLVLTPAAEMDGNQAAVILADIVEKVPAPR